MQRALTADGEGAHSSLVSLLPYWLLLLSPFLQTCQYWGSLGIGSWKFMYLHHLSHLILPRPKFILLILTSS